MTIINRFFDLKYRAEKILHKAIAQLKMFFQLSEVHLNCFVL